MRSGGHQHEVPGLPVATPGVDQGAQEFMTLLPSTPPWRGRTRVGLVHDDELGAGPEELLAAAIALDVVGGDDGEGVAFEEGLVLAAGALETGRGPRQHQLGIDVELSNQHALPLFGQVRRNEDGERSDLGAIE